MAPTGTTYRPGVVLLVVLALLAGCASSPGAAAGDLPTSQGGAPDLTGTVDRATDPDDALLADASDDGHDGMSLHLDDTALVDADGHPVDPAAVPDGATVEVWIDECAESLPPLCTVDVVRVTSALAP
ncbi:hypothetical protein [Cellulomonas oligotrophica]|uniref:DUF5666 domain-containing protein n=1 Tax=Cellulomonas oligotrophica TaxID=931536 RepID=A0A7Y9FHD1_9CELL|nr:hypothetical protein [Cellulomonas oligotrophica]NYD87368.1 hypothetical protein [Cellulomonas oligotrophica]GIG34544.1 hypothetical protein Col01nite_37030 [Cellulomonas oligotrophica]